MESGPPFPETVIDMRRRASIRRWFVALACVCAAAVGVAPVSGQAGSGRLSGVVVTGEQQRLEDVIVEVRSGDRVVARVQTDTAGTFGLELPAGRYQLKGQLDGYLEVELTDVTITGGQTTRVTLRMDPQPVALEGLEAVSTPIRISTVDTDFGKTVREEAIRALPLGREARDVVELTPGSRADHVWGGATLQANSYQLDGVAANHPGVGGDMITPSLNWIESIEVRGLGAGAEYGNFQGGLINVITKSGTNDFQGAFRVTTESHNFNASALGRHEIGSEVSGRNDIEGEVRGPILRDRLFYFLAGQYIAEDRRHINHLEPADRRYLPTLEERLEGRFFGKLTFRPMTNHVIEASAARVESNTDHYGLTGYEDPEGTLEVRAPTASYSASWRGQFGQRTAVEARFGHFTRDEVREPYNDEGVPGVQTWGLNPPYLIWQNAPLRFRHAPESTGGSLSVVLVPQVFGREHQFRIGVERNVGSFVDQRLRNGGMTWRPSRLRTLQKDDASTWAVSAAPFVASVWGGEVNLHAEVESSAAYLQSALALTPRLTVTPGVRYSEWAGYLLPGGRAQDRFQAVSTSAFEPRIGAIYDLAGDSSLVFKAHWGRYHQGLVAQMFERVQGGEVFTDEETWYYRGDPFSDPSTRFTREQRDALAAEGKFTREAVIRLSETGPVHDFKQPYVDQWIVGLEKTFSDVLKFSALYVNRRNRNMVALVDRNRESNYTVYNHVRVLDGGGQYLPFEGGTVQLQELHIPNYVLVERLRCKASGLCPDAAFPPHLTLADTARLTWNPDYVLTNAPGAQRKFDQFQVTAEVVRPSWTLSISGVITSLEGNLDNVTGYDDPSGFGAGPYVRVNEGVNSYGTLPNFADRELKVSFFGNLPWGLRGGVFWNRASGDHYAPYFTITTTGAYQFEIFGGPPTGTFNPSPQMLPIDAGWLEDLEGHRIFVGPRGLKQHHRRAQFDLRLEREIVWDGRGLTLSLDIFNIVNSAIVTDVNRSVNRGQNFIRPDGDGPPMEGTFRIIDPAEFYKAVRGRVPPRTVRLGASVTF